jgi:hypothetical protein
VKTDVLPGALTARLADAERVHNAVIGALGAARGRLAALTFRIEDFWQATGQLDRASAPASIIPIIEPPAPRPVRTVAALEIDEVIRFPARSAGATA